MKEILKNVGHIFFILVIWNIVFAMALTDLIRQAFTRSK